MKDIDGKTFVSFKRVCPLMRFEYEDDKSVMVPCLSDLHVNHRTDSPVYWVARDGVEEPPTFEPDDGDDWWQLVCEDGHVLLEASDGAYSPRSFDANFLDDLNCPTMREASHDRWQLVG